MNLERFLRDLSPLRATGLFLVAFLLGSFAVLANWGSLLAWTILPTVPIIAYSFVLWTSQVHYSVSHGHEIKTSPYILGFLLTLVSLFGLFRKIGLDPLSRDIDDLELLVGQVGAALATTAVGLVSRQILITTDPAENQREKIFQSLAGDLRQNANEFDSAQRKLVSLIQEFVSSREELFSREEQAFQKFLDGLERGSQILTEIETTYPQRLQETLSTFDKHLVTLDKTVSDAGQSVGDLCAAARERSEDLARTGRNVEEHMSESVQHWDDASRSLTTALNTSAESLKLATGEAVTLQSELKDTQGAVRVIVEQLQLLPEQVGQVVQNIGVETTAANENTASLLSGLLQDVKAVDKIVDEVTELLTKQVERLKTDG